MHYQHLIKTSPSKEAQARPLTREDWTLIASVTGERLRPLDGGSAIQGMLVGP